MNIIAVALGIGLFIYSISIFIQAREHYRFKQMDPWWLVLIVLVIFFLAGYLLFEYYLITGREIIHFRAIVAQVFLWGAFFVLVCAKIFVAIPLESHKIEMAVRKVNEYFLKFGPDAKENLRLITRAAEEVFGAKGALYSRKEGGRFATLAGWRGQKDKPEHDLGNICFDLATSTSGEPIVIRDLLRSGYAETDPNVKEHQLQVYVGCPIRLDQAVIAALCVVFTNKFEPEAYQLELLKILCRAAAVEENRQSAEAALLESMGSYRALAENIPGIVYRIDLKDQNKMEFFNQMHRVLTGYRTEELRLGEICSIDPLIIDEDKKKIVETVREAIKNRIPFEIEYRIKHKDGAIRHFWEKGRPVYDLKGGARHIDGVIFDVTERKEAESKAKEDMEVHAQLAKLAEGRELKLIEREKEVNQLLKELGRGPQYT